MTSPFSLSWKTKSSNNCKNKPSANYSQVLSAVGEERWGGGAGGMRFNCSHIQEQSAL